MSPKATSVTHLCVRVYVCVCARVHGVTKICACQREYKNKSIYRTVSLQVDYSSHEDVASTHVLPCKSLHFWLLVAAAANVGYCDGWWSLNQSAKPLLIQTVVQPPLLPFTVIDCLADSAVCSVAGEKLSGALGFNWTVKRRPSLAFSDCVEVCEVLTLQIWRKTALEMWVLFVKHETHVGWCLSLTWCWIFNKKMDSWNLTLNNQIQILSRAH